MSMDLHRITIKPGVNLQMTQTQNRTNWWASNLVRWQNGMLEKIGGWLRLISTQTAGLVRAMHAYEDLSLTNQLLLGTDGGAQVYNSTSGLNTFTFGRRGTSPSTVSITFSNTSASAAVHDVGSAVTVGNSVTLLMTISGGGHIYLAGTQFVIATKVDADNYTITLPVAATASGVATVPTVSSNGAGAWAIPNNNLPLSITLANHGLLVGGTFAIQYAMQETDATSGITFNLPAGSYTVGLVLNANNFTLSGQTMNATLASPVTSAENDGNIPLIYPSSSQPTSVLNWSLDNFGQIGLINYQNGPIFAFTPPSSINPSADQIQNAPSINTGMFVSMPQAQIIAFGADVSGVQDPMLLRWCDTSDYNNWTASATNQAGSNRLSSGSRIVGGAQAPQTNLIWTDVGVWSMTYIGAPLVYSFYEIGKNCGLIAPGAWGILGASVYWMGNRQFYVYNGQAATDMPCDVWDFVFNDLDEDNESKCTVGTNSAFNEVFFFFPSASGGTGEIDSYVKATINGQSVLWDTGRLGRTCWIDQSVFGQAIGADLNRRLQQHDVGYDDDGAAMEGVFVESGYVDVGDGNDIMMINDIIPDMKWFGGPGAVSVTLKGTMYPQGSFRQKGPYGMDQANKHIRPRMRARQIAMRIDWIARLGYSARFGDWRFRAGGAGKRP